MSTLRSRDQEPLPRRGGGAHGLSVPQTHHPLYVMPYDPKPVARLKDPTAVRRFRLERLGEPCEVCELRSGSEVHHSTFRSQGGDDVPHNFRWLCTHCHRALHDGRLKRYIDG
jgi:hypothetical protein